MTFFFLMRDDVLYHIFTLKPYETQSHTIDATLIFKVEF